MDCSFLVAALFLTGRAFGSSLLGPMDNLMVLDKHQSGVFGLIAQSPLKLCELSSDTNKNVSEVNIYWHGPKNKDNWKRPLHLAADDLLREKHFDKSLDFALIYPGFNTRPEGFNKIFLNAYKAKIPHTNIMFVDHFSYTHSSFVELESYRKTINYMHSIANAVARFLVKLFKNGLPLKNMHVVGHSFGAQSAGVLGQYFKAYTGKLIRRCTGLDPCGPCLNRAPRDFQINSGDCDFVDCHHTNEGEMGTVNAICDVDFFPNGNFSTQPGCGKKRPLNRLDSDMGCSHLRSIALWLEAVHNDEAIVARKCHSWGNFIDGKCSNSRIVSGGLTLPSSTEGNYIYRTRSKAEFTIGRPGADPTKKESDT